MPARSITTKSTIEEVLARPRRCARNRIIIPIDVLNQIFRSGREGRRGWSQWNIHINYSSTSYCEPFEGAGVCGRWNLQKILLRLRRWSDYSSEMNHRDPVVSDNRNRPCTTSRDCSEPARGRSRGETAQRDEPARASYHRTRHT